LPRRRPARKVEQYGDCADKPDLTVKTMLAFAIGCTLLGGCAIAPYDDDFPGRYHGQLRGEQRLHRDPIPYRYDGDYHRLLNDRDEDAGHHDQWR
jgi:hypothetical protein